MNKRKIFSHRRSLVVLPIIAMLPTISLLPAGDVGIVDDWPLVWADEFDKDGKPNPRNWTYETGFVRNEEAQWYQAENAWCEKGMLIIEGRRERRPNPSYAPDGKNWKTRRKHAEYTSASLTTKGLQQWRYGRFEMRARIDTRMGVWPCFWTMGIEGEWPACGEIDIMEYYQGILRANVAWGSLLRWVPRWDIVTKPVRQFPDTEWVSKFHVWRMDWDEQHIRLFVDGVLLNSTDLSGTVNPGGRNPFRHPHYLLLSLAIGGSSGGNPAQTRFPARFEVDYVRVYQPKTGPKN